ncbi:MAG: hypothetical protein ACM30G_20490 [Micromonosporaceae bacterium]
MTSAQSAPAGPTGPGRERYLIGSSDRGLLADLIDQLPEREGMRVDRVLNTSSGVGAIVVEATPEAVTQLRSELGPRVVIEPDQPLDSLPPVAPDLDPGATSTVEGDAQ